ncbi:hypothetical protein C2E23DRAFT_882465 [Lenzites betulinus]|nr:hypothetical protein C2E23DRAFT_882465 [Lenzites betulinus]
MSESASIIDDAGGSTVEISNWLQCRVRFRHAAEAIVHHTAIWRGDVPDRIVDKICEGYREHIDAAHAWLHASLNLWEKADNEGKGGLLPFDIAPSPSTAATLSLALEQNETYLRLLEQAVQMSLAYLAREREMLQEWSEDQATKLAEGVA